MEIHLALSIYCDRLSAYMNCHLNQLASLLVSGDFSDCKIVTNDGRQYNCHKAILCLKSEVIRMAFEVSDKKKMLESQTNEFRFDCDSQIAEAILLFVYKGEAPHITEDTAAELFRVAHLYQIVQLQSFLAYEIVKKATELVKISNVLEFVTFANRYDIVKFKTFCLSFIHANKSPVFSLPEWKEFYSNNRELVTQLLLM